MTNAWCVSQRMNQLVLEDLDPRAWRAQLPGQKRGRSIAAIFCHVHNVRCKWIRLSAPHLKPPALLQGSRCQLREAMEGLGESAALCSRMLSEALGTRDSAREDSRRENGRGGVTKFMRDGWARPWPAGAGMLISMFAYMITHEAHHRGQVCMLAHQLGYPLSDKVTSGMWNWEKLWKDGGFGRLD